MNYKTKADPFGQALQDYVSGDREARITVHCSITEEDVMLVSHLFRNFEMLPWLELEALAACRGKILDVGAGAGSHALILQQQGKDVTALDISAGAVEVMKERGVQQVILADIFELQQPAFDTILMLMNGIGLAGTLDGLDRLLQHLKMLLNPGGQILLDSSDLLYMYTEDDGSVLLQLNGAYYGEVDYRLEYKGLAGEPFGWLFVDFQTLQDHALAQGYHCEMLAENDTDQYLARLVLMP
jgi:SAM-dependent methyltransferase